MTDDTTITVTKLEAAVRQLQCAIEIWFRDGDVVSMHTLSRAAYDIIHDLNEHQGMPLDLLYNSDHIKEEYHTEWAMRLRAPGNFAKHADRDPEKSMSFSSERNLGFIIHAIRGLAALKASIPPHVTAFNVWLAVHDSDLMKPEYRKTLVDHFGVEALTELKSSTKEKYLQGVLQLIAEGRI